MALWLFSNVVRGYRIYKEVWTPRTVEELLVEKEPGNSQDKHAVYSQLSSLCTRWTIFKMFDDLDFSIASDCTRVVTCPALKSRKRVWCSEQHFLAHGVGLNGVKNVTIALLHCRHTRSRA